MYLSLSLSLSLYLSLSLCFLVRSCLLITLIKCLKGHKSLGSLCSVVKTLIVSGARRTKGQTRWPIEDRSFKVFSKCICHCHCLCLCICLCCCLFFGQIMSPHHFDQMSERSQVSRIALWRWSLNVFVFVIVIVFVFVFVIVFLFVRSCLLITLITCLKGHKSLRVLYDSVFQQCLVGS